MGWANEDYEPYGIGLAPLTWNFARKRRAVSVFGGFICLLSPYGYSAAYYFNSFIFIMLRLIDNYVHFVKALTYKSYRLAM